MGTLTERTEDLRVVYNQAFKRWTLEVTRLQEARRKDASDAGVLEAERRSEAAQAEYRKTRDELAEALAGVAAPGTRDC